MRVLTCLLAMVLLAGCAAPAPSAPPASAPSKGSPSQGSPTQGSDKRITQAEAVAAAAKQVDMNTLEPREAVFLEKYSVKGKELAVWRVPFQTKDGKQLQITYYVDAATGEVVWAENAK